MTTLHTNDIDVAAIIQPSTTPQRRLVAPTVSHTPCRTPGCRHVIQHVGDLVVGTCDSCLDELEGLVEVAAPTRRRVEVDNDEEWETVGPHEDVEHTSEPLDVDDIITRAPLRLRQEIFTASVTKAEQSSAATPASAPDADLGMVCATCCNETAHVCECGRRCCAECVDEVGRCPACDGGEEV